MQRTPGLLPSLLLAACGRGGGEASLRFSANPAAASGQRVAQRTGALSAEAPQPHTAPTFQSSDGIPMRAPA